jgi:diacylglycerol O-acyltransferase
VSLRTPAERGTTGNRVANVHAHLPIGESDPEALLRRVHEHLDELKSSHEIEATGLFLRTGELVPRLLADRIVRTVLRRQRNVETVITDVPGPREPLHLGPYRMIEGYPVAPIAGRVRVTIALWSYCDRLFIGVTGDHATTPDLGRLAAGIERGVDRLLAAARAG